MKPDLRPAPHASLHEEMRNIIEETRVILPGLQALFGFQTIAVFNDRFGDLPEFARDCHLAGLSMVVVSIAFIVFPAVYYRYVGSDYLYPQMLRTSTRMIRAALLFLALGLSLDMFTVIFAATDHILASAIGAAMSISLLLALWFMLPIAARRAARRRGPNTNAGAPVPASFKE